MTPIADVFMLSIDSKLDYDLLKKICQTGHSRVPVYEEVDAPVQMRGAPSKPKNQRVTKVKKIVGILLVKQCVLLDPKGRSLSFSNLQIFTHTHTLRQTLSPYAKFPSTRSLLCPTTNPSSASLTSSKKVALTWPSSVASASKRFVIPFPQHPSTNLHPITGCQRQTRRQARSHPPSHVPRRYGRL